MSTEQAPPHLDQFADELIAEHREGIPQMPDDMPPWMAKTIVGIDTAMIWFGKIACWLLVPIMVAMVYEVIARKLFLAPTLWAFDISRMFYGALFMLGAAYGLAVGVHIRADFLYRNYSVRMQGAVDSVLFILFYFPGLIAFFLAAWGYAAKSLGRWETAGDSTWAPPVAPLKVVMCVAVGLLLVQGVSELLKSLYAARRGRWPV